MSSEPSIAHAFERNAARYGTRVFLREKRDSTWKGLSWSEVAAASRRTREGLLRLGLTPGDRLAILAENCPQWVIVDLAALGMGGVVVPLYPTSSANEIEHVLGNSGTRAIAVHGEENLKKVTAVAPRLPELETIVMMRGDVPPVAASQPRDRSA